MKEQHERKYNDSFYDAARQSFSQTLWVPLIMLGADLAVSVVAVAAADIAGIDILGNPVFVILISTVPMYIVGLPLGWLVLRKMPRVHRQKHHLRFGQLMKYFLISMAAVYAGNIIGILLQEGIAAVTGIYPEYEVGDLVSSIPYSLVFGLTVVAAPIVEELVFRKLLIDRIQQYGTRLAILFSGISFGLFHGNITQCFYAAILGMLFAYVYTRTGRVIYPILLHMMVNGYSGLLELMVTDAGEVGAAELSALSGLSSDPALSAQTIYGGITLLLVVIGTILFIREKKNLRFARAGMELEREDVFSVAFLNSGFLVLLGYFLFSTVSTYLTMGA